MAFEHQFIKSLRDYHYRLDMMGREIIGYLKAKDTYDTKPQYKNLIEEIRTFAIPKLKHPDTDVKFWSNRVLDKTRTLETTWNNMFERDEQEYRHQKQAKLQEQINSNPLLKDAIAFTKKMNRKYSKKAIETEKIAENLLPKIDKFIELNKSNKKKIKLTYNKQTGLPDFQIYD